MFIWLSIILGRKNCITPTWFIYSYYHGTQHMQLRTWCKLSCFIVTLATKKRMQGMSNYMEGVCMSEHNMWLMTTKGMWLAEQKHAKWICMIMEWLMQMQCMNMINGKYRNDMSIMTLCRDAWYDQGNKTWRVCFMSLIQETNGKDPKVHYLVTTPKGTFM